VRHLGSAAAAALLAVAFSARASAIPAPDHVIVVILENHSYGQIIGSADAPFINQLAAQGANFTNDPALDPLSLRSGMHAVMHPSQPNYLQLFSGSSQGVVQDGYRGSLTEPFSASPPFTTPNLGAAMVQGGHSFATYSKSLPAVVVLKTTHISSTAAPRVSQTGLLGRPRQSSRMSCQGARWTRTPTATAT
jgi:hypothetical protein